MDGRRTVVQLSAEEREVLSFSKKSIPALERVLPAIQLVLPAVVPAAGGWGAKRTPTA